MFAASPTSMERCLAALFSLLVVAFSSPTHADVCDYIFGPGSASLTRNTPRGLSVADFNTDGVRDIAVINNGFPGVGGSVTIHFGRINSFDDGIAYPVAGGPYALVTADLTGDGILDIATANNVSGNIAVLPGLGTNGVGNGQFGSPLYAPAGAAPFHLDAGDLDGDGIVDLAVANYGLSGRVSILRGLGAGSFELPVAYPVAPNPSMLKIAFIDGDTLPDVAVVEHGSNTVAVLLGRGAAVFDTARHVLAGEMPYGLLVRDLNADGKQDIVVACLSTSSFGGTGVLLGNGDGTFADPIRYNATGVIPLSADLDGDGFQDLLVGGARFGREMKILYAQNVTGVPNGLHTLRLLPTPQFLEPLGMALEDFDGDGHPDLAVTEPTGQHLDLYRGVCSAPVTRGPSVGSWQDNGVEVCRAPGNQVSPLLVPDGLGGTIVTWQDTRNGADLDLYAQRLDGSGRKIWDASGMPVCAAAGNQQNPVAVGDGNGGVFVAWLDRRTSTRQIYLQHLGPDGTPTTGWPSAGIQLFDSLALVRTWPSLATDGAGGVYIAGDKVDSYTRILLQRMSASGTPAPGWPPLGFEVASSPLGGFSYFTHLQPTVVADGNQGVYVAFGGNFYDDHHGAHTRTSWAELRHVSAARVITSFPDMGYSSNTDVRPELFAGDANGVYMTYRDATTFWLSRFPTTGPPTWLIPLSGATEMPRVAAGPTGAAIAWTGTPLFASLIGLDGTGLAEWTAGGTMLSLHPGRINVQICLDGTDKTLVTWSDPRYGDHDLFMDLFGPGGFSSLYPTDGALVSGSPGIQANGAMASPFPGTVVIAWADARNPETGTDLYAQRIDTDAVVSVAVTALEPEVHGGHVRLRWRFAGTPREELQVFRSTDGGRSWNNLGSARSASGSVVTFVDSTARPGTRSGYRLESSGPREDSFGEVWVLVPERPVFALEIASSNPLRDDLVRLRLGFATGLDIHVECFDVGGRRRWSHVLRASGGAAREIDFSARGWDAGVYWFRATQGGESRTARLTVLR